MLTIEHKAKFLSLAAQLSPENLSCDGELNRSQVKVRYSHIMKEWVKLEREAGIEVTEEQAYRWSKEVREYHEQLRAAEMAKEPQHPLLEHDNPGVWSRPGKNGLSAYYIWGPAHTLKDDEYRLYSYFALRLDHSELLGTYSSLEAAVSAAEKYLKTVTAERYKAVDPRSCDEWIACELGRLP